MTEAETKIEILLMRIGELEEMCGQYAKDIGFLKSMLYQKDMEIKELEEKVDELKSELEVK